MDTTTELIETFKEAKAQSWKLHWAHDKKKKNYKLQFFKGAASKILMKEFVYSDQQMQNHPCKLKKIIDAIDKKYPNAAKYELYGHRIVQSFLYQGIQHIEHSVQTDVRNDDLTFGYFTTVDSNARNTVVKNLKELVVVSYNREKLAENLYVLTSAVSTMWDSVVAKSLEKELPDVEEKVNLAITLGYTLQELQECILSGAYPRAHCSITLPEMNGAP